MITIFIPIAILGSLGLLFGAGLAIASRKFAIEQDPRLNKIKELLPGANCGACGKPGCEGLAEAILNGEALPDECRIAEEKIREEIAAIM
ncbi:MAG: RnfABCDGE type electron transport complex subunit B, partial [Candidatus Omnitrophica bacterium]|nr:RnfABCDGE type electron transport complex subunit B [Candidatus Omnitrophota bacterium]